MQRHMRLHITPFHPELLPVVLPEAIRDKATAISFHDIQTFPEKNYGYISLPADEAQKLRRRLNGCFLKGQKMKVEEARSSTLAKDEKLEDDRIDSSEKKKRSRKAVLNRNGAISAVELPHDRRVNRGWTDKEDDKGKGAKKLREKQEKKGKSKASSVTGEAECLFKTKLPANVHLASQDKVAKVKKRKRGEDDRNIVVHEFKNTTKNASWLRDTVISDLKNTREYVEGKGWVDEAGNIVEKPKKRRKSAETQITRQRKSQGNVQTLPGIMKPQVDNSEDETSSSGTTSSASEVKETKANISDSSASDEELQEANDQKGLGITNVDHGIHAADVERLSISRSSGSPVPHVNPQPTSAPPIEVHPLEALFKRPSAAASQTQTPKKPHLEVSTSFSFFDAGGAEPIGTLVPQTPFTQQDIRYRRQRSAAPTPDTAAPGKTFGNVWGAEDADDDDEEGRDGQAAAGGTEGANTVDGNKESENKTESQFEKWFWEHRGENNRAWKRRRREAAKEKRAEDRKERRA